MGTRSFNSFIVKGWEATNPNLEFPPLTSPQNWVPHVSRFWRHGIPPPHEGDAGVATNDGFPILSQFHRERVGGHEPRPRVPTFPLTTEGSAPCRPVLETWATTAA